MPEIILKETAYEIEKLYNKIGNMDSLIFLIHMASSAGPCPIDDFVGALNILSETSTEIYNEITEIKNALSEYLKENKE